ncbi:uncharacterized protein LOC114297861 isoform X2 [Camellia sinensis]|uniref:uncharacterized protein LOC114297861 isoform X2 n=1 Tax=Camellia sinensis TaxID=4442 RepID=UPI0010363281|nr:uncharacterized protein LOC114297861 isoform X2 [Camellia sinensis]
MVTGQSYGRARKKMFLCIFPTFEIWFAWLELKEMQVIDAYTELLLSEQDVLAAGVEFPEKSYFFTNICLDMAKHTSVTSRDKYIEIHMRAADDVR